MISTTICAVNGTHRTPAQHSIPIVGVLCIDVATKLKAHGDEIHSYIAASYVKYLEAQRAHVIPIWIGRERAYYVHIMTKVNGVLLPGGAVFIDSAQVTTATPNACVQSAAWIIDIAMEMNAHGRHMPIWGTCLGYQLLLLLHMAAVRGTAPADVVDFRTRCTKMECLRPWQLTADYRASRLLQPLSESQLACYTSQPIAVHYHQYCITTQSFHEQRCDVHWRPLATQRDDDGMEFITLVEHRVYPFYGIQSHPECAAYERDANMQCNEAAIEAAIEAAQYLAQRFVGECRKSPNVMTEAERLCHSICNFTVTYTAHTTHGHWQQCYLFQSDVDYPTDVDRR